MIRPARPTLAEVPLADLSLSALGATARPNATLFTAAVDTNGNGVADRFLQSQGDIGGLIPGFGEGLSTMRVGGRRILFIPSRIVYNNAPGNPAGDLIFEVELLAVAKRKRGEYVLHPNPPRTTNTVATRLPVARAPGFPSTPDACG
ncbi:MAG: FKBP-type peptidyl-prolyl cis-trans isomerase [Planctomycetia bacterium]|nr:FKBP-type peptidyl-prolyl cis-trans isomerase [Planctomycetia bacterium]